MYKQEDAMYVVHKLKFPLNLHHKHQGKPDRRRENKKMKLESQPN